MTPASRSLPPELLALLVCPACRGDLELRDGGLFCAEEALWYPVVDGVPHLIVEAAEKR